MNLNRMLDIYRFVQVLSFFLFLFFAEILLILSLFRS